MNCIMDTHAWIEYFRGSKKGEEVKKIVDNKNNKLITLECCMAELKSYCLRNNINHDKLLEVVSINSFILPVSQDLWLDAANVKFELRKDRQGFGLIDAILVAKQRKLKCHLISGDPHFKSLKNVIYIGN